MKNISLLLASLFICLSSAEAFFRWKEREIDKHWYVYPPNKAYIFEPNPSILYGISGSKKFSTNSSGYRSINDFSPQTENWLCVGGSTTECTYLDDSQTWYSLLEKKLGSQFRIASIGKSGHISKNHYNYLNRILSEDKNIKGVVLMCGLNDLVKVLANPQLDLSILKKESTLHMCFAGRINESGIVSHSALLWYIKEKLTLQNKNKSILLDRTGAILTQWRANYNSKSAVISNLPKLENSLKTYQTNLEEIIQLCASKKTKLIVLNQSAIWKSKPTDFEQKLLWMGGLGDYQNHKGCAYYSTAALDEGLRLFNETTKKICLQKNIPFVDLYSSLPKDTSVFYDDCHFNEHGAKKVAEIIFSVSLKNLKP